MISFKRLAHATDTAVVALIVFHLILWFRSMGGTEGITSHQSYPFSLFVVPIVVWVTALAAFYVVIYPLATGIRFACNQIRLTRLHGFFLFLIVAAVISAWPARAFGGYWLLWVGYFGLGFAALWKNGTTAT